MFGQNILYLPLYVDTSKYFIPLMKTLRFILQESRYKMKVL